MFQGDQKTVICCNLTSETFFAIHYAFNRKGFGQVQIFVSPTLKRSEDVKQHSRQPVSHFSIDSLKANFLKFFFITLMWTFSSICYLALEKNRKTCRWADRGLMTQLKTKGDNVPLSSGIHYFAMSLYIKKKKKIRL